MEIQESNKVKAEAYIDTKGFMSIRCPSCHHQFFKADQKGKKTIEIKCVKCASLLLIEI
jgi:predicted Zn finger-like uncharacterized protein